MKKTVLLVVVTFALWSCGASQSARVYGNKNISNNNSYSYKNNGNSNGNPSKSAGKKSSKEGLNPKVANILSDAEKLFFIVTFIRISSYM